MAVNEREGLYEHSEFAGLRNVVPVDRFELGDLSIARNVDIDDSKRVTRRKGHSAAVVTGACRSLWSNGATALAVRNGSSLVQVQPDYSVATLRSDLTAALDMYYAEMAGRVYYSNGMELGVVDGGQSRSWGISVPGSPGAALTGGVLQAGAYQFTTTFLRSDGQESGALPAGVATLASTGGIRLTGIAISADPDVSHVAVYFSKRDGDTLYRVGSIVNGTTTFDYLLEAAMKIPLSTQHLRAPLPGRFVDVFNGRTLVAVGDTLIFSEPYAPELFDHRKNLRMGESITLVVALDSCVYVGTSSGVVVLRGDTPEKWQYLPRLSYGAIAGAATKCSRDMILDGVGSGLVAVFATTQGICVGDDGGQVVNLTQDRFSYPVQDRGAVVVRRHRGFVQALASFQGTEQSGNSTS